MRRYLASILAVIVSLGVVAGQSFAKEIEDMSLSEILDMKVSIASKKSETISESAGVISVITSADIKKLGYETLNDVIKTVPGVTTTESFFGYTSISFRGIMESHYNNRTLLLLNGYAVKDTTVGTYLLEAIPVNVIDRIEIIRGPGSVVYGNGAFAGVINIITKQGIDTTEISALGGSKSAVDVEVLTSMNKPCMGYIVGASYRDTAGYKVNAKDETGAIAQMGYNAKDTDAMEDDYYNVFANVTSKDLKVDLFSFKQQRDKFGITPNHLYPGEVEAWGSGAAVNYSKKIASVDIKSVVNYSQSNYKGYLNIFPNLAVGRPLDMVYSGAMLGVNIDGMIPVNDNLNILTGVAYENDKSDPYEFKDAETGAISTFSSFLKGYSTNDLSLYSQVEVIPSSMLKIIGGVRYNNNSDYGSATVPRASVVAKVKDGLYVKALYGSAYRNPTFFEKYVNTRNVLYGDPNLKPEKIDTYELAADWMLEKTSLRLTVYTVSTNDMIGRVKTYVAGDVPAIVTLENRPTSTAPSAATPGYGNTDGQNITGSEFEVKGQAGEKISYTFNVSYKQGTEKANSSDIQYLDKLVANVILSRKCSEKVTNTISLNYVGDRTGNIGIAGVGTGFTNGQSITVPAFTLVNWRASVAITNNLSADLIIVNLFEKEYCYPEYIRRKIDVIPADPSRSVYAKATYKF